MILLCTYIVLNYIAQETLLPPVLHSMTMYAFIVWTALKVLRRGKVRLKRYTLWYLSVIGFSAVSMLWAVEAETDTLYVMAVSLVLTFCILETLDSLEKLEVCMLTFVIAGNLMGIMLAVTGQVAMGESERLGEEITGNANSFAVLLMVSAVFAGWFLVFKQGLVKKVCLISLVFQLFLMGLSGGRKYLIVALLCLLWYILAKDRGRSRKIVKNLFIAAAILYAAYWAVMKIPVLYNSIGYRFEDMMVMFFTGEGKDAGDIMRTRMIEIGLERWMWSPIWGYGLDTFKHYNQQVTGFLYYAHNNYVELLYDLGVIGLIMYYGFYVHLVFRLRNVQRKFVEYEILGMGIIVGLLILEMGSISFYSVFIQIVLSMAYALITIVRKSWE